MSPFLNPLIAWSAFGLASIPIIIHLLNRRRLRRIDWAAMEFLLAALKKNKRRVRLEQLILLLVRIALMILLALFISRPIFDSRGLGWLAGALSSEEKIFVLDDSLSMSQRAADRPIFARALGALADSVGRLAELNSRDKLTILRTSRPGAPLIEGGFVDRERAASLSRGIQEMELTGTRARIGDVLARIAERGAGTSPEPRVLSILTDLRSADWTDGQGGPDAGILAALEELTSNEDVPTRIVILDVGASSGDNVAIQDVEIEGGRPTVGIPAHVRISVRNTGFSPLDGVRLRLSYAPVSADPASASMAIAPAIPRIEPGATETVSVTCSFRTPGEYWAAAELSGGADSIQEDNRLAAVFDVVEATDVLLVNGEPSSERFEGETDFLAVALRPSGEASTGVRPHIVVEDSLPSESLGRYGAIFLANVYRLPEEFLTRIGEYVRSGGALFVFLGDQVDPSIYARDLGVAVGPPDPEHPARGLLPAEIGAVRNNVEAPVSLVPVLSHPAMEFLRGGGESYLRDVGIHRFFELAPLPTAQVLATFGDGEESPAIIDMGVDAGRVLLFATTADSEWHDWPRNPTFFIILQELLRVAGHRPARHPIHPAGAVVELPFDLTRFDSQGTTLRGPDYPRTPERQLFAAARSDDPARFRVLVEDTLVPGLSFLRYRGTGGEADEMHAIAVRSEIEESELARISASDLARLYPDLPITVVEDPSRFSDTGRGRFEAADLFLGAFAVLLFVEGLLALYFAHHRRNSERSANAPSATSATSARAQVTP